jgi:membrane protein DedA with SNARE-associated domain
VLVVPVVAAPGDHVQVQAGGAVGDRICITAGEVPCLRGTAGPLTHLILTYGYLAVFGLITAEYLGVPLPGETALIVAAAYAGHTHRLSVWLIFVLAVMAAVLGDYLGYLAGLKGGYRLLLRWGPVIGLDHAKIKAGRYVFDRHGGKVVFISRFVTVLRTYAAFVAGTNRMRWGRFSLFNVAGGVAWAVIYTFVPYHGGQLLARLSTFATIIGLAVAAVMVTVVTLLIRRGAARLTARAEAAFPGPLDQGAPGTSWPATATFHWSSPKPSATSSPSALQREIHPQSTGVRGAGPLDHWD